MHVMNPTLSKARFLIFSMGLTGLAFVLRLHKLSDQELWLDEAASFFKAEIPNLNVSGAFYYWLLHGWMQVFGQDEVALRLFSALLGSLFVVAACWAGSVIFSPSAGLWSGLIAAMSPIHVYYSQEVRGYVLLVLLLMLTYLACWRAVRCGTWWAWVTATCLALLSCTTHYFAIFALIPVAYLVYVWPEPRRPVQRWLPLALAAGAVLTVIAPWVYWRHVNMPDPLVGATWIKEVWMNTPPLLAIPKSLELFWLGGQSGLIPMRMQRFDILQFPVPIRWLGLGLLMFLGIWIIVPWKDSALKIPELRERKGWIMAQLGLPLLILWLVSFVKPLYLTGRYDLITFPAFVLLMGLSLAKLQQIGRIGKFLAGIIAALFLLVTSLKLNLYYETDGQQLSRPIAVALDRFAEDGDVVIFTGLQGLPTLYALHGLGYRWQDGSCRKLGNHRQFWCRMFPRETEKQPAIYDPSRIAPSPTAIHDDLNEFLAPLRNRAGSVWMVFDGTLNRNTQDYGIRSHDVAFIEELKRAGFQKPTMPFASFPLLVQFQRP